MIKALRSLLLIVLMASGIQNRNYAQTILGIDRLPPNPTSNDTISIYAHCSFNSGNCDPSNSGLSVNGNTIISYAIHCLGPLSFICGYTDTFKIPPLSAGNYQLAFYLESGYGSSCTPGIVPGPTDTISFMVAAATGIQEIDQLNSFELSPNPSTGEIQLKFSFLNTADHFVEIRSVTGFLLNKFLITSSEMNIVLDIPSGIYLCRLSDETDEMKKLIVIRQ